MKNRKKIIVIGGSAAGPKAAAKARRLDQHADITIIQKDTDLSMASCGYPYYVSGEVKDRKSLISTAYGIIRDPDFFQTSKGIQAFIETEVSEIDRKNHTVTCKNLKTGEITRFDYDKLIIATGARAKLPPIAGNTLPGISTMHSMPDVDYLKTARDQGAIKQAIVIGGGLIGIEVCEALQISGIQVTVVEMLPQVLTFLDWELAKLVENHVRSKTAKVITDLAVSEFIGKEKLEAIKLSDGTSLPCELAVIAIGVSPNTTLARKAGLSIGKFGGIDVNKYMQTSDPDIYAIGDCVEVNNRITGNKTFAPMGDLANLQGRVAGENAAAGNRVTFPGTIQTGICKVFDFSAGSTGLSETRARAAGFNIISVITAGPDKPAFMNGKPLVTKMVAEAVTGKVLGVQCVGLGDVSKQIGQAAMAIQGNLTVEDLSNADLPYAPPFSLAIDNLIATAHSLGNKMKGRLESISAVEVKSRLDNGKTPFILDIREQHEYDMIHLGIGEKLIPLGEVRSRMDELPQDKEREIICYCKVSLRGYETSLFLKANGWKNVKVMEGGILAWPFALEQ
ncbi:MAG: FAD-dependent oxidoreductase [Desulfobacterales bacterium]|nr:FAD-dependent oxidoreductase [Desulfobacterales bacterium]MDD4072873.1 FAD-dependent oxidoreductase [Desulfobacterales bacterium]MDD4392827.1 FAD-dependent oxidoreductase [Desulfobacterales bacterium]